MNPLPPIKNNLISRCILLIFIISGCTRLVPMEVPHYEPYPIFRSGAVGIYMSPELEKYKISYNPKNDCSLNIYFCSFYTYVYPLGERFRSILHKVTKSMFKDIYIYDSLEKFEHDYQDGKFQYILSVQSLEGDIKISTKRESWRCYQLLFDLAPQGMPLVSSCRIKAVLASRKKQNGKVFSIPLEAKASEKIITPSLSCDKQYFTSTANQAFSQIASDYAQMISHVF